MSVESALKEMVASLVKEEVDRRLADYRPANDGPSDNMTTKQAAVYLKLAVVTLEQMRARGDGPPYYRSGKRRIIYKRSELDAWLKSR